MSKIQALLPEKHRERVEGLLEKVEMQIPERSQRSPMLEGLVALLEEGKWAKFTYRSGGPAFPVIAKPLRILADRGFWYLRALTEGEERAYRVDRIEAIEECAPPVDQPTAEPLPYSHPSHPQVRVRLSAKGIRRVENDQHLYSLVAAAEPPFTLEFHCPPSELDWYARYFGEMGEDALVELPAELIDRIRDRAQKILGLYEKSLDR